MNKLESLEYDTIVLGGTLEALIHSYVEGIPLIMVNPQIPFHLDNDPHGFNKERIWSKLSYYLSYAGLNPIGLKAGNYRLDEDNKITIFGKTTYKVEIQYKEVIRYDQIQPTEKLRVFDFIKLENIQLPDIQTINNIKTNEEFIDSFYTMIGGRASDVVAISSLTQEQVNSEEYSVVYARMKTEDLLKKSGIIGRIEKMKNRSRIHKLKTTTLKREYIFDTRKQEDTILSERRETKSSQMKKITEMLGSPYVD